MIAALLLWVGCAGAGCPGPNTTCTFTETATAVDCGPINSCTGTETPTSTGTETDTVTATATATSSTTETATSTSTPTASATSTPSLTPTAPLAYPDDPVYGSAWVAGNILRIFELDRSPPYQQQTCVAVYPNQTPAVYATVDPYRRLVRIQNRSDSVRMEWNTGPFDRGTGDCIEPLDEVIVTRPMGGTREIWLASESGTPEARLCGQPD